jgi:hypothetical protein
MTDYQKNKVLNSLLILSSFIGYLEWVKDKKLFLFQLELEIISKVFSDPASVLHPLIILPFAGQLILLITLIQRKPNKVLILIGIAGLGILLGLMFVIGLMSLNFKILFSTFPFLMFAILTIRYHTKKTNP